MVQRRGAGLSACSGERNVSSKAAPVVDKVREGGLRYRTKKAGSMFAPEGALVGFLGSSMSCFKCGKHRPMMSLVNRKILGINRKICDGGCNKVEAVPER